MVKSFFIKLLLLCLISQRAFAQVSNSEGLSPIEGVVIRKSQLDQPQVVKPGVFFKDCAGCPLMATVPSGSFLMGSNSDTVSKNLIQESPQHLVNIQAFAIGRYEVTQDEWELLIGNNPSSNEGSTNPVENVSWDDAQTFVQKLSHKTGKNYRLPSEAEWEYAARAGSLTSYPMGNTDSELHEYAWINAKKSNPVGFKKPNGYGLYDMLGNVWEWTQDCWNSGYAAAPTDGSAWLSGNCYERVLRGGGFFHSSEALRYAKRTFHKKDNKFYAYHGFRVAMDL